MKFWRRMREHFPSFSEGLSLRPCDFSDGKRFPGNFPSFSEGLSLRVRFAEHALTSQRRFPFLFGGAFIEASTEWAWRWKQKYFPSFWEGLSLRLCDSGGISEVSIWDFHSLLEGLSLRCLGVVINPSAQMLISLPNRRGFH